MLSAFPASEMKLTVAILRSFRSTLPALGATVALTACGGGSGENAPSASGGMEGTQAGEAHVFGGIDMVWCPPGEFAMGSTGSLAENRFVYFFRETVLRRPRHRVVYRSDQQHRVELTRGFWLAKTETTQEQWESAMRSNPSRFKGADLPVETVSWDDCQEWLSEMNQRHALPEGWQWALPTEAQWEYACRAGTRGEYAGDLDEMAWYDANSVGKTHPVGTKRANAWGLHDMHGNVWEWCADRFGGYPSGTAIDPAGPASGSYRVFRGCSWVKPARSCQSAYRNRDASDGRHSFVGFRAAAVPARRWYPCSVPNDSAAASGVEWVE